jgi:short-subunit dehydrogenase
MDIAGRTVLITGASSGIGAAAARAAARRGARVLLVARHRERLARVRAEVRSIGGFADVYAVDLSNPLAVGDTMATLLDDHGAPDVLVNNAGAGRWLAVEETPPEEALAMMAAPYLAAFYVTQALLPEMIARRSGHIVNVNSPAALVPIPGAAGYTAARWALRGFTAALRAELAGTRIGVTQFTPGKVSSDYFLHNPGSEERIPAISRWIPVLSPDEAAERMWDAVRARRADVTVPAMLSFLRVAHHWFPSLVERLVWSTGWRRPRVAIPVDIRQPARV